MLLYAVESHGFPKTSVCRSLKDSFNNKNYHLQILFDLHDVDFLIRSTAWELLECIYCDNRGGKLQF